MTSSTYPSLVSAHPRASLRALIWAALGVVFGDIGTSPLYAMSETVSSHLMVTHDLKDKVTLHFGQYYGKDEVFGWTSLFFWAIAIVVTLKYVVLIMKADNAGEGGMFSILGLVQSRGARMFSARAMTIMIGMAVVGAGLILGDGIITPSLSIMSAWEGLQIMAPNAAPYVPWLAVATLILLFGIQRFGTARVGAIFAPAMAIWFATLALTGVVSIVKHPEIMGALSPFRAVRYFVQFPRATLFVIGSVDLCITGCEALYADMGHFGRPAVRKAWFWIVWPALVLNYLGQGARLLDAEPIVDGNVFYALVPSSPAFVYPLVIISWLATIIASQALISGAFSLVHQATQLGLFPRVNVVHTNAHVEGQIYVPFVNWAYLLACILLVVSFRNAHSLSPAYGLAVTGTMFLTTALFYLVATRVWGWHKWLTAPVCAALACIDVGFFLSNATQFFDGGYITLLFAAATSFVMLTWRRGRAALAKALQSSSMPMDLFLSSLKEEKPHRVQGSAIFMSSNAGVPLSLVHYFKHAKTLHERIVFLTVQTSHVPEVPEDERIREITELGEGLFAAKIAYGFMESPDVPLALQKLRGLGVELDMHDLSFFLGRESLVFTGKSPMSLTRKVFFKFLSQNAVPASSFFRLPSGRVVELGMQIEI